MTNQKSLKWGRGPGGILITDNNALCRALCCTLKLALEKNRRGIYYFKLKKKAVSYFKHSWKQGFKWCELCSQDSSTITVYFSSALSAGFILEQAVSMQCTSLSWVLCLKCMVSVNQFLWLSLSKPGLSLPWNWGYGVNLPSLQQLKKSHTIWKWKKI